MTEINLTAEVSVYLGLGFFALLGWLFTYFMIPETAGKPIEQILEDILGKDYKNKAKKTTGKVKEATSLE